MNGRKKSIKTTLFHEKLLLLLPECIEVVPLRQIGAAMRIGEHEDSGGKREAEGSKPEDDNQNVEPPELVYGDAGVEVRRRRSLNDAVSNLR